MTRYAVNDVTVYEIATGNAVCVFGIPDGFVLVPEGWLAIGHGEGGAEMRVVKDDAEMVEWLWNQCGPDSSGDETKTREYWAEYVADEDNWTHLDELRRWRCHIEIGETGHIEFIRLLLAAPPPLAWPDEATQRANAELVARLLNEKAST